MGDSGTVYLKDGNTCQGPCWMTDGNIPKAHNSEISLGRLTYFFSCVHMWIHPCIPICMCTHVIVPECIFLSMCIPCVCTILVGSIMCPIYACTHRPIYPWTHILCSNMHVYEHMYIYGHLTDHLEAFLWTVKAYENENTSQKIRNSSDLSCPAMYPWSHTYVLYVYVCTHMDLQTSGWPSWGIFLETQSLFKWEHFPENQKVFKPSSPLLCCITILGA